MQKNGNGGNAVYATDWRGDVMMHSGSTTAGIVVSLVSQSTAAVAALTERICKRLT